MMELTNRSLLAILWKLVLCGVALRFFIVYTHRLFFNKLSHVPGPFVAKFTDWYGAYHSFMGQLHIRTYRAHRRHGSAIRLGPNKVAFDTISALQTIYTTKAVQKSKGYAPISPPHVSNIHNTIDKDVHRFKRKVINQGLSDSKMRDFEPDMNFHIQKYIQQIVEKCTDSEWSTEINMTQAFKHLGYDIMSQFGFGQSFNLQGNEKNRFIVKAVDMASAMFGSFQQFADLPKYKVHLVYALKALKAHKPFVALTNQLVRDRVAMGKDAQKDLFSFIIDAKDPDTGRSFSEQELFTEARVLIVAGSDTSSTTLTALMFYLSRYPECYAKLANEIRSTFSSAEEICSGTKMNACTYLRACIDEALRMTPPLGSPQWREVAPGSGGLIIDDIYVPEGCDVGVGAYSIHHNEKYFPNSFTFNPDRWIPSSTNSKEAIDQSRRAFCAFSLGPRGCVGKTMAYMEISNALAKTMWYLDFEKPSGSELGRVGEGIVNGEIGRSNIDEFQLEDHLVSVHDGPWLRFRLRKGVTQELK